MCFEKNNDQGFTLLEVLVSLTILVVGALGVFALMTRTVDTTDKNRRSIITVNLAREGIEIIRSMRDSSDYGFDTLTAGVWIVDSDPVNFGTLTAANDVVVNSCNDCKLYLKNNQYLHDNTGTVTDIRRLITIADGSTVICGATSPCEKVVTVYVLSPTDNEPYILIEHLTDWR